MPPPSISRLMENPLANQALMGSLSHFGLIAVLRLLQTAGVDGRLELMRGEERTDLFLEGRTLFARTNGPAMRLGEALVRRGDLRPEAIELALSIQNERPEGRLGQMLVSNGVVTAEQVREAVLDVQRSIVITAMKWRMGMFRFGPGERLSGEEVRLDFDVDRLVTWALDDADQQLDDADEAAA